MTQQVFDDLRKHLSAHPELEQHEVVPCKECNGLGWNYYAERIVACAFCNGNGWRKRRVK